MRRCYSRGRGRTPWGPGQVRGVEFGGEDGADEGGFPIGFGLGGWCGRRIGDRCARRFRLGVASVGPAEGDATAGRLRADPLAVLATVHAGEIVRDGGGGAARRRARALAAARGDPRVVGLALAPRHAVANAHPSRQPLGERKNVRGRHRGTRARRVCANDAKTPRETLEGRARATRPEWTDPRVACGLRRLVRLTCAKLRESRKFPSAQTTRFPASVCGEKMPTVAEKFFTDENRRPASPASPDSLAPQHLQRRDGVDARELRVPPLSNPVRRGERGRATHPSSVPAVPQIRELLLRRHRLGALPCGETEPRGD